jgi:hypothetical protein
VPGSIAVAETYPAECYGWFSKEPLGGKRNQDDRRKFGASLLRWADAQSVTLEDGLREEIHDGFSQGDDAFDAVVGLFGMLQVCLGQRESGEPDGRGADSSSIARNSSGAGGHGSAGRSAADRSATITSGVGEPQTGADFIDEGGSGRKKCLRTSSEKRQLRALGISGDVKLTRSVVRAGTPHRELDWSASSHLRM